MKTPRFLAGLPCFSATEVRGGRLRGRACASEPSDTYAWAVMSVGPDALLYGESVIAMLGLAPHKPDSHVRGNSSTNTAKASG